MTFAEGLVWAALIVVVVGVLSGGLLFEVGVLPPSSRDVPAIDVDRIEAAERKRARKAARRLAERARGRRC